MSEVYIIRNNRLGNVLKVMTAQSNGSPRNVTVLECSLVQDVHPLVKLLLEEVDETDEMAALDSMEMEPGYGGVDKVMEP